VLEGVFQDECGDYQIMLGSGAGTELLVLDGEFNDAIERFEPLSSLMPASRT
jgi:hypothetical protein